MVRSTHITGPTHPLSGDRQRCPEQRQDMCVGDTSYLVSPFDTK